MKKLLLISVLIVTFGALFLGCAAKAQSETDAVEDAITGLFSAYNTGNYDKCTDYLVGVTDENKDTIKAELAMAHGFTGDIVVQVENVTTDGSTATATVTATVQNQTQTTEMTLTKVNGKWKMAGEEAFSQD